MNKELYVGNIPFATTEGELESLFGEAGTVESVTIKTDRDTGRSRGFGFVQFSSEEEASQAIKSFDGHDLNGRKLRVNFARPKQERP